MVLNVVQTYRSQQAAERLRDEVAPTAAVLPDGTWIDLPRRELVPGDVIESAPCRGLLGKWHQRCAFTPYRRCGDFRRPWRGRGQGCRGYSPARAHPRRP